MEETLSVSDFDQFKVSLMNMAQVKVSLENFSFNQKLKVFIDHDKKI